MSSRYSPSALLWESVKAETSKNKILISIAVALVFIIVLIACIATRGGHNDTAIEKTFKPESQKRSGASSPTTEDDPAQPQEPSKVGLPSKGIYFATYGGTVNFFSPATPNVTRIYTGDEDLRGITYDPVNAKLYWSSHRKIYRGNMDGGETTVIFNTNLYGEIKALAFDWITGNIYGVCFETGYIFACNTKASPLVCSIVLSNQGQPNGLALNPTEGRMYWAMETNSSLGYIRRAEMDGSNVITLKRGLTFPYGITIDYRSSRLYWTDFGTQTIWTSDLDGNNLHAVAQRSGNGWAGIWGIALLNDRIYWSTRDSMKLESCDKNGTNVRLEYTGERENVHMVSTDLELHGNRTNHCASRSCAKLCVLTAHSSRCLN